MKEAHFIDALSKELSQSAGKQGEDGPFVPTEYCPPAVLSRWQASWELLQKNLGLDPTEMVHASQIDRLSDNSLRNAGSACLGLACIAETMGFDAPHPG